MMDCATIDGNGEDLRGDMRRRDFIRLASAAAAIPAFSVLGRRKPGGAVVLGFWPTTGISDTVIFGELSFRNSLPVIILRALIFRSIAVASASKPL
jgi:hypothetical protein